MIFGSGSKRTFILLYFILYGIWNFGYANDYSVFEKNHKKGLKDQRGKELIPAEHDDLGWSDGSTQVVNGIIGYRKGDVWGIINVNNTKVTNATYNDLFSFTNNILIASRLDSYKLNSLFGLINNSGKTIIDFKYNSLKRFGENLIASKKLENNIYYGLINTKDEPIVPFKYKATRLMTPDILALRDQFNLFRLINSSGGSILDIVVDEVKVFADKFLMITRDGKTGLTDLKGKTIAPINYQQIYINENGLINALPIRTWDRLSENGTPINSLSYDQITPIDTGLYKTRRSNYAFIINDKGEEIFRIKNSGIQFLNDSLALFYYRNRYGVIHYNGDTIVRPIYDSIKISGNRFFLYTKKSNQSGWVLADLYGITLSTKEFEAIYHLDNINLAFKKNGFWGIIDCYGNEKIFAKYDSIYTKINDLYLVDFYGEKGVIDADGEWRVYPQKGEVYMLKNGNYMISSYYPPYHLFTVLPYHRFALPPFHRICNQNSTIQHLYTQTGNHLQPVFYLPGIRLLLLYSRSFFYKSHLIN